eukprot:6196267-Pleurochrysis_carterae.AAC.1
MRRSRRVLASAVLRVRARVSPLLSRRLAGLGLPARAAGEDAATRSTRVAGCRTAHLSALHLGWAKSSLARFDERSPRVVEWQRRRRTKRLQRSGVDGKHKRT